MQPAGICIFKGTLFHFMGNPFHRMITIWLQNNDTLRNKICQGEQVGKSPQFLLNIGEKVKRKLCRTHKALRCIAEISRKKAGHVMCEFLEKDHRNRYTIAD